MLVGLVPVFEVGGVFVAGRGERGQRVAVVGGIGTPRDQAVAFELLDQPGDGGAVDGERLAKVTVGGLATAPEADQNLHPLGAHPDRAGEPLPELRRRVGDFAEEEVLGGLGVHQLFLPPIVDNIKSWEARAIRSEYKPSL